MPTTRQFVLGLTVAVVGGAVAAILGLPPAWLFGAVALGFVLISVRLFRDDPRVRRPRPALLIVSSVLLGELVFVLAAVDYFRLWMVAAGVLATLLASATGLLVTQGRERRQIATYIAIGLLVILVPAVLLFLVSHAPLF
jgi:hypothetical protein